MEWWAVLLETPHHLWKIHWCTPAKWQDEQKLSCRPDGLASAHPQTWSRMKKAACLATCNVLTHSSHCTHRAVWTHKSTHILNDAYDRNAGLLAKGQLSSHITNGNCLNWDEKNNNNNNDNNNNNNESLHSIRICNTVSALHIIVKQSLKVISHFNTFWKMNRKCRTFTAATAIMEDSPVLVQGVCVVPAITCAISPAGWSLQ